MTGDVLPVLGPPPGGHLLTQVQEVVQVLVRIYKLMYYTTLHYTTLHYTILH